MPTDDECPFHELARIDPHSEVQVYDEYGRYVGLSSAEMACDSHHLGVYISWQLTAAMEHYGYR